MKKKISDYDLKGKKVIIRVDFNVPIKNGIILDENRIKESLKTIQYAMDHQAKVILLSHLGRIQEESDLAKNSLKPVATALENLLGTKVIFLPMNVGKEVEETIANLKEGEVLLLENTRYQDLEGKKESNNDPQLSTYWASLGDIFINDAFGTIHRSHASNVGISSHLPNGIGFLVEKELKYLSLLDHPTRPYMVILGGAKVSDKIHVIENLVQQADYLLIGGAMAFTFLKAKNLEVGKSMIEEEWIPFCQEILAKYKDKILLPVDLLVSESMESPHNLEKSIEEVKENEMGLDIGTQTIENMKEILKNAKTVVWNGPLGYYEKKEYQKGTKEILSFLTENQIPTILGGGDIVAASKVLGYFTKVTHASTGGGATLEYLEGKKLPGLEIIQNKE